MMRLRVIQRAAAMLLTGMAASGASADCGLALDGGQIGLPPPGATVLAAYGTIRNVGTAPVSLTGASSPDFNLAGFHRTMEMSGMMHMMQVPTLTIPAHGSVTLAPGDLHIMLSTPTHPLAAGDSVSVLVQCEANTQAMHFSVKAP